MIPDNVVSIGRASFYSNDNLETVELSEGLKYIGDFAFNQCAIREIDLPNSLTEIGQGAFDGNNLTTVTIPTGIEVLKCDIFVFNALETIEIPSNIRYIGVGAFSYNNLTSIKIPSSISEFYFEGYWQGSFFWYNVVIVPELFNGF